MIPEISDIPDKYSNLALTFSLSVLQEDRVKSSCSQEINKLTRCCHAITML